MRIDLHDAFYLSELRDGDQPALVEHLNDKKTADRLMRIPYPYTMADADHWVRHCEEGAKERGRPHHFACRRHDGYLVGGVGFQMNRPVTSAHRAELGYWIAKEYRNRGLATAAARALIAHGFGELGLRRIEATVSLLNRASHRVLEKAGLQREGVLAGYHLKEGELIDVYLFAILAQVEPSPP
jgi:RimJ/RimL family protein N-acetyltransferase